MCISDVAFHLQWQIILEEPINHKCDVFSYAMVVFEMASNKKPFHDTPDVLVPSKIVYEKSVSCIFHVTLQLM